ncbi:MAG TPA: glycerol kinase GlpK [Planctomycetota bacterium]
MPAHDQLVLAIDQGTTSTRAILFDGAGQMRGSGQQEFVQHYPQQGWVEHDADEIWSATLNVCQQALAWAKAPAPGIAALGITNQRETVVVWERASGRPIHRALVWQDRRTADACRSLRQAGHETRVQELTGLLLDPYFSATKLGWILDEVPGARAAAERGELACGTMECFLLWRLTGGAVHATDASNASRTLLFDIHAQDWSEELLQLFRVPREILPEVRDCAGDFGTVAGAAAEALGAAFPICGMAGDQQAATLGQACFAPGSLKITYGTGCFAMLNTGSDVVRSRNRLLSTVAWRLDGETTYALEGSIFAAGSAVQWLRDELGILKGAEESEALAAAADPRQRVYMVPAFTGLGAPYWDPHARGAVLGLTRDSGREEIARATLEAVGFQTRDLLSAMQADGAGRPPSLRVDGGLVCNDWAMQFLADITGIPVERPSVIETTALGAAFLAGLHTGVYASQESFAALWRREALFEPAMPAGERDERYAGWQDSVARVRSKQQG